MWVAGCDRRPPPPNAEKQKRESTCPATLLSYGGNYMRVYSGGRRRSIGWSQRLVSGALFRGQTEIPRDYGKRRAASVWWRVFYGQALSGPLTPLSLWAQPSFEFLSGLKKPGFVSVADASSADNKMLPRASVFLPGPRRHKGSPYSSKRWPWWPPTTTHPPQRLWNS